MNTAPVSFEQLDTWKPARIVVRKLYTLTRYGNLSGDFGLIGQVRRAGVSVMSNVAEGFEQHHVPEKLQFYNIAGGSAAEVRSLLYVIEDNYPEQAQEAISLRAEAQSLSRMVCGLIRSTEKRRTSGNALKFLKTLCAAFGL